MSVITEVEKLAVALSESERAKLAERLLGTLNPVASDSDNGVAEAQRRYDELVRSPEIGITLEELDRKMNQRFP